MERIGEVQEGGPSFSGIDEYRYQLPLIRTQTRDSIGRYRMGLLSVREQDRKGEVHTCYVKCRPLDRLRLHIFDFLKLPIT
jgi:hypothetical protein